MPQTDLLDGYGIFKGESALEYISRLNPNARENKRGGRTFSYSSYSTMWECPLRYAWRYVDKRKPKVQPDERNMLEGGALHTAIENFIQERPEDIAGWINKNADRFFDDTVSGLKRCVWKSRMDEEKARDKYVKLVARACLYARDRVFNDMFVKAVEVEQEFIVNITPTVTINGFMDLVLLKQADNSPPFLDIVDWKGGKPWYVKKEQLMFYGLAGMALYQVPVNNLSFVYPGTNDVSNYYFSDEDYEGLIFKLKALSDSVVRGERSPAKDKKACKWCVYEPECEEKPL